MGNPPDHNDAVIMVTVQLIISLLVMPVTPLLWICGAGHMTSFVQRLARISPVVWSMFFCVMMPGPIHNFADVLIVSLWPQDWYDATFYTLAGALCILFVAPGSYFVARFFRWGSRPQMPDQSKSRNREGSTDSKDAIGETGCEDRSESGIGAKAIGWLWLFAELLFPVVEALGVEIAWRVYLLSRILFALGPIAALFSMAMLATLSDIPAVLYVVCSDTPIIIQYANRDDPHDIRQFYRDSPPASTTVSFAAHLVLKNCVLGIVVMLCNFCVLPAALLSIYWSHVAKIVSGRMLVATYLPAGMEALAVQRLSSDSGEHAVKAWIRGPPWKVSCEGLAGILLMSPLLIVLYQYARSVDSWRQALKVVLPPGTIL